jgi:teichuronic acid biosynthesis glycosyltransferase TuaH
MLFINPSGIDMVKGRDIIVIGIQPWYFEIGSNCKNIALEFAKHNRVLYVNTPVNRKTYYSEPTGAGISEHINIIKNKSEGIRKIQDNLWQFFPACILESINWIPNTTAFKKLNYLNNKRFAKEILLPINELGFQDFILFNDNDFFTGVHLNEMLKPSVYIYYSRDYLRGFDYWKKHGDKLEPEMISRADAAVANSVYLSDYCSAFNKHSYYVGQGCDLQLFDPDLMHPQPEELKGLKGPVIGYVGAITSERLDPQIIKIIASTHPEWNVVMVGPEDKIFRESELHQMANVIFTGRKTLDELPAYVQHFNVCINPQLVNQATKGNYPLKVDEYLAMGKPVVATHTPAMEAFREHCYLAAEPADYPALIETALEYNCPSSAEKRKAFARTHTWENSVAGIYDVIRKIEEEKKKI